MPAPRRSRSSSSKPADAAPVPARVALEPIAEADRRKLSLASKIALMIGEVGNVEKRGWNDFHKYEYVRETDLVAAIGPLLAKYRVAILPSVRGVDRVGDLTTVQMTFELHDGDSGQVVIMNWAGQGSDKSDKGLYKAYTGGVKYFLMKMLQVATGDDPEGFTKVDEQAAATEVRITHSDEKPVQRGGHSEGGTIAQIQGISSLSQALNLGPEGVAHVIEQELGVALELPLDVKDASRVLAEFLAMQNAADLGKIAVAMRDLVVVEPVGDGGYG